MKNIVRKCISDIRRRIIPAGYKRTQQGIKPIHWEELSFNDILRNVVRKVAKPQTAYWRLGVKSHAKGTFRELVENPETVDMDELFVVQANDLIVNITFAWEHAIAIVNKDDTGLLVSHRFPTYVFNRNVLPDFFKYVITQKWMQKQLDLIFPGGAGRNRVMNKSAFLKIPCCVPPLAEQKRIAEILGCCDRVIALKKELIAEKKKQKKALMQKLLNPDSGFRLPGFKGKWKKNTIGEIGTFAKGKGIQNAQCKESGFPCVKYGDIYMKYSVSFDVAESFTTKDVFDHSLQVMSGVLLFTCSGEDSREIGKCTLYTGKDPIAVGGDIIVMYPYESISPAFLAYQQYSYGLIRQKNAFGKGNSIVHIHLPEISSLKISLPPTCQEQQAIADILFAADKEIDVLEQELTQQQQKKKSLMQLLLTGIVRV